MLTKIIICLQYFRNFYGSDLLFILIYLNIPNRIFRMDNVNAASSSHLNVNYCTESYEQSRQLQQLYQKQLKKEGLDYLYNEDYQPANYQKACQYRDRKSYKKKLADGTYREIGLLESTQQLKAFGLGIYFFIEFYRRISWFFFIASFPAIFLIYLNWAGNGLSDYSISYSTFLIYASLGNYSGSVLTQQDGYFVTIIPIVIYIGLVIFFFKWKYDYFSELSQQQKNVDIIRPQKFCIEVSGFKNECLDQQKVEQFYSLYGPVYEVSFVRRYGNKLFYFEKLDALNEKIKEQELQIILGSGNIQYCDSLQKQRDQLQNRLKTIQISPELFSAYVHFQFEKSKVDMLNWYNQNYLFDTYGHSCVRFLCCCCFTNIPQKHIFQGNILKVKNQKVPDPQDINWDYYQLSLLSKASRYACALAVILIFIIISSTIIGLCSVYISGNSIDCTGINIPSSVASASVSTDPNVKLCFCNSNLYSSINNSEISSYCGDLIQKLYIQQGIQWVVVIVSCLTNFIFGMIVHLLVNFVRPISLSSGLLTKTTVYTCFMIFNTIVLPILLYANIFGFKATNYVSFITIISSNAYNLLNVDSISLFPDFQPLWYRYVSPIYTNYILLDIFSTWAFFFYYKFISNKPSLKNYEGRILQKHMNQQIASFQYNVYSEHAYFNLILIMGVLLSAGIPILWPLTFLSLFSKYVTMRNVFQNNSSKVQGLGDSYMALQLTLIPLIIICSCLFGCWMLTGNSSIYPNALPMAIATNSIEIINRQAYLPFYMFLAGIMTIYLFFYNTIVRFWLWVTSLCYKSKQTAHPYHVLTFSEYAKKMNVLHSYNIRNNDKYKNAMLSLEKYLLDKKS